MPTATPVTISTAVLEEVATFIRGLPRTNVLIVASSGAQATEATGYLKAIRLGHGTPDILDQDKKRLFGVRKVVATRQDLEAVIIREQVLSWDHYHLVFLHEWETEEVAALPLRAHRLFGSPRTIWIGNDQVANEADLGEGRQPYDGLLFPKSHLGQPIFTFSDEEIDPEFYIPFDSLVPAELQNLLSQRGTWKMDSYFRGSLLLTEVTYYDRVGMRRYVSMAPGDSWDAKQMAELQLLLQLQRSRIVKGCESLVAREF